MPYTPDATDVANPTDTGVKAATAAAEFRAIKLYIRDTLVAGLAAKAPLASPVFTGVPAAPTAAAGVSTTQLATTAFTQQEINRVTGLVVNVAGNVGIGTGAPAAKLHVVGDIQQENAQYVRGKTAAAVISRIFGIAGTDSLYVGSIDTPLAGGTLFVNNGTSQAVLTAAGNLGIGTGAPVDRLHVAGAMRASNGANAAGVYADASGAIFEAAAGVAALRLRTGSADRLEILPSGDIAINTQTSIPVLGATGALVMTRVSDTQLRFSMRGSDAITRSVILTLS